MKIMMFAALAIAAPALAQTAPAADPVAQAPATTGDTMATPQADPAAPAPAADPAAPAPMADPAAPATAAAPAGEGGYAPPPAAPIPAGATVRFQQAPTPDQAYPAPAPLAKYPVCKKGQTDKCMNRGGK